MGFEKIDKRPCPGIEAYEGVELQLEITLTLALNVGKWSTSSLKRLLPGKEPLFHNEKEVVWALQQVPALLNADLSLSHARQWTTVPRLSTLYSSHYSDWKLTNCSAERSLVRSGRKQARKHVRDAHDCNNIETRVVAKYFSLQGKAPKKILPILTETLAWFFLGGLRTYQHPCRIYYSGFRKGGHFQLVGSWGNKLGDGQCWL